MVNEKFIQMLGAYGLIPRKNATELEKETIDYFNKIADIGYRINESLRHFSNLFDDTDLDSITDDEWKYMLSVLRKLYISIHKCENEFDDLLYDTQKITEDSFVIKSDKTLAYAERLNKNNRKSNKRKVD